MYQITWLDGFSRGFVFECFANQNVSLFADPQIMRQLCQPTYDNQGMNMEVSLRDYETYHSHAILLLRVDLCCTSWRRFTNFSGIVMNMIAFL